ncbi:MAG: hypothetical protein ACJ77K_17805 [Bacteroidia bacterium]
MIKRCSFLVAVLTAGIFSSGAFAQNDTAKKTEFKPSGKVWGLVFGDYFDKIHADSINRGNVQYSNTPKDMNAFDLRRVYLGYDYNISEKLSTEFLLSYEGQTLSDNATRTFFLKAANLRCKNVFKGADLVVGQMPTPGFPMLTEKVWAYRSVEKTIADMRRTINSNDVGVALQGKLNKAGDYGYNIMIGNGSAQKIETDIFKKFYGDIYAKFLKQKVVVDLYADYEETKVLPRYHRSRATGKLFIAYTTDVFTAGFELFQQTAKNNAIAANTSTGKTDTLNSNTVGYSFYVRGRIIKEKLGYFARFDSYDPDTEFDPERIYLSGGASTTEMFVTAGLDYTPHKNLHIIPNIWYDGFNSRAKNAKGATKSDYDMAARLTCYFIFK